jgi:iron(III) transport system substrate-binding protein
MRHSKISGAAIYAVAVLAGAIAGMAWSGAALAQAKPASVADIAMYTGGDRQQMLTDGAKGEGEVSLYTSMPKDDVEALATVFTKQTGIKLKVWRASSEQVTQRVATEARGHRYDVDIIENSTPSLLALRREKLLQEVRSPAQDNVVPQALPDHHEWTDSTFDAFVQAYNTDKVKKEDLPKSYQDLLDPKWKGKLGIEAADGVWLATIIDALGKDKGTELFQKIVATNGISVRSGHSLLTNLVASGEVPLALTTYNYSPAQLKAKGAPIDWFLMPPTVAQFRGVALTKQAPHPHAALLWYDFMLSDTAQKILADRYNYPTSKHLDSPLGHSQIIFVDPAQALDKDQEWTRQFQQIIVRNAR